MRSPQTNEPDDVQADGGLGHPEGCESLSLEAGEMPEAPPVKPGLKPGLMAQLRRLTGLLT